MVAASSADAPAATSNPLAISISRSACTFGMVSSLPGWREQGGEAGHCQPRREWRNLRATDDGGSEPWQAKQMYMPAWLGQSAAATRTRARLACFVGRQKPACGNM